MRIPSPGGDATDADSSKTTSNGTDNDRDVRSDRSGS